MLHDNTECGYYSCDNSADYIAYNSDGVNNLTGDGVIYPKYAPFANAEHSTGLAEAPDHSGAWYCADSTAKCSTTVVDPVLKPLPSLAIDHGGAYYCGNSTASCSADIPVPVLKPLPQLYEPADHSGAFYCVEPEAKCSLEVVDPVLKPLPAAAVGHAPAPTEAKSQRPTPGAFMLCAHACILGAAEATTSFAADPFKEGALKRWSEDFARNATANADAVTPVGGVMLREALRI
mmetsp:Transcript_27381/g.67584  ORF Transcript_27381/g.67584 Transcript_27381/m.67584 type:complete len:234 (+) Transcript_27381:351-1052(+)